MFNAETCPKAISALSLVSSLSALDPDPDPDPDTELEVRLLYASKALIPSFLAFSNSLRRVAASFFSFSISPNFLSTSSRYAFNTVILVSNFDSSLSL